MALTTCSECSKEISDRAVVCPNCGAPLPAMTNDEIIEEATRNKLLANRKVAGVPFWIGVAWLLLVVFYGSEWNPLIGYLIGFGLLWYIVGEIDRNLFERKIEKQRKISKTN